MVKKVSELKTISIKEMDIRKFIISKCGEHNRDSLNKTIEKKTTDLDNCRFCLWSHGNLNSTHTRAFCEHWAHEMEKDLYVIMPYITSNSTEKSKEVTFTEWDDGIHKEKVPLNMNKVTGAPKSNRAFYFDAIYRLEEKLDFKAIYPYYDAVNEGDITNDARNTMKRCSNKCLKIKENIDIESILKEVVVDEGGCTVLVGRLKKPYHVELIE